MEGQSDVGRESSRLWGGMLSRLNDCERDNIPLHQEHHSF